MTQAPSAAFPEAANFWTSADRALEMARVVLGSADAPVGLTPKEVIWRKNKARLYRYLRSEPATHQTPIFLVLPLINRSYILDLRPGASFVERCGRGGETSCVVLTHRFACSGCGTYRVEREIGH